MQTLVSMLVALSIEKYYMALTEIQIKMCRFHASLSQKDSRPPGIKLHRDNATYYLLNRTHLFTDIVCN